MQLFVMMPFKEEFTEIRTSIREAGTRASVHCVWADEILTAGKITEHIESEIRKSWACIADITGQNPNVAWEIGFAQSLGKPVITLSQSPQDLFFDLKDQRTIVYSTDNLAKTLAQPLTIWLERLRASQPTVPPEDLIGTTGHEKTSLVLGAKRIVDAPYDFFSLLARAKEHVFIAAQNHFFFAERPERGEQLRSELRRFLEISKSRRVDIMLCDKNAKYSVRAWQYVTGKRYSRDLEIATIFFEELANWAGTIPDIAGRLTIRKVPSVPISITFVDPQRNDGFLVLTPNCYEEKNSVRPCFVVSRSKNDDIFQQYWPAYFQRFNDIFA